MAKEVPIGVKIISVLYYIAAGFAILFGLIFLVLSAFFKDKMMQVSASYGGLGTALFIILGLLIIGIGVLDIFLGIYLWRGKAWARIVIIILSGIIGLSALVSLVQGNISSIVNLAVQCGIAGYLLFNTEVKDAFM